MISKFLPTAVFLAMTLSCGSALAQATRINLPEEVGELNAMGFTITESEDAAGNSVLTYDLGSSQPETRVTFQDCNASGCATAVFRQKIEGACISQFCRDFREARGITAPRRLTDEDLTGLDESRQAVTIHLQDGDHAQEVVIAHTWAARPGQRFSKAVLGIDQHMSEVRDLVRDILRPGQ